MKSKSAGASAIPTLMAAEQDMIEQIAAFMKYQNSVFREQLTELYNYQQFVTVRFIKFV